MLSKRKRIGIIIISLIISSFTIGFIVRGYAADPNPTIDPILGLYNFPWVNTSIGFNTHSLLIDGVNYTDEIKSYANYTTDHGEMTGLSDDDHNQYLFQDGSEELAGDWDAGSYGINASWFEASEFYLNSEDKTDYLNQQKHVGATAYVGFDESLDFMENYFSCDGTDDDIQINAAKTHLNSLGGGLIYLDVGVYDISATVYLSSNIRLSGSNNKGTILTASTANMAVIIVQNCLRVSIEHLGIDGNHLAKTGILIDNTQHSLFFDLYITNVNYSSTSRAINIFGGGSEGEHCTWNLFKFIWIYECYYGLRLSRTLDVSYSNANWFENIYCGTIQEVAFYVDDGGNNTGLTHNKFINCGAQTANYGYIIGGIMNNVLWCYVENMVTKECQDEGDRNEWQGSDAVNINLPGGSSRCVINGLGQNGANDPDTSGDWYENGYEGLMVQWDNGSGTDYISIYGGGYWISWIIS